MRRSVSSRVSPSPPDGRRRLRVCALAVASVALAGLVSACAIVSVDQSKDTIAAALRLARTERTEIWASAIDGNAADLVRFVSPDRVLVGDILGGSLFGSARLGPLRLLDAQTGQVLWSMSRLDATDASHSLLATAPRILLHSTSSERSELRALDPAGGTAAWERTWPAATTASAVVEGRLHVGGPSFVESVSSQTGETLWQRTVDASGEGLTLSATQGVVVSGRAIESLDPESGRVRWRLDAELPAAAPGEVRAVIDRPDGLIVWTSRGVARVDERVSVGLVRQPIVRV